MKKAFTILELLVVLAVLAILIGIALPRFKGMQDNSKMTKAKAELRTIRAALESYKTFDTSKRYPPSTTTLGSTYLVSAAPRLLKEVLYDPFGATQTTEYNYLASSSGQYFVVWTVGFNDEQPTAISDDGVLTY